MRSRRVVVVSLVVGASLAATVPGAAQGVGASTAKATFKLSVPDSGQIVLAKLTLTVKAAKGKALPKRAKLNLHLQGTLSPSVAVIAGPSQFRKLSAKKGQLTEYVEVINKRAAPSAAGALARATALRSNITAPFLFLAGPAVPAALVAKGALPLTVSGGLTVGATPSQFLSETARRAACTNNLKQIALALHALHSPDGASPQDAWGAGWNYGCGHPAAKYLLPYLETTGKYANCTVHVGTFQTDNFLDLSGCPMSVSSVTVLAPNATGWGTSYTRSSTWVVFNPSSPSSFYTGACTSDGWPYYPPDPWSTGFRCDLGTRPMVPGTGLHFQVAFGPAQPNGTQLFIGVLDPSGLDFGIPALVG